METSNPTLNNKVFANAQVVGGQTMTVQGTVNKTLVLFGILLLTAAWAWSKAFDPSARGLVSMLMMIGLIGGLAVGIATSFKPNWSPITAPIYAALQGLAMAGFSLFFEAKYPGIVIQAVGLTFGVLLAMLVGYKSGFLQATPGLRKGIFIATSGLFLFYGIVMFAGMFGVPAPAFINGGGPLGIIFSMVVVGLAAMSLVVNFDIIERASEEGVAKHMEWYGAFSMMVTLIWLYVELLRLLSKMQSRD